ncbi:MAG TPA: peptidase U34 [Anaerolineaceae bacterium]|nr:peptidase U34 [Anaerolineaceae bacterium]
MCDTIGLLTTGKAYFAKNSDRSPNEPQVAEFYPAADHSAGSLLKTTYISIDQAAHTHSLLLSRPTWLWGGEMGVNEFGVCIGNEAVFTRGKYAKTGLTGMDLLRLGLERGNSAREARDVIIRLLEEHGQGGNCGFDHQFFYDNSFLIMDREHLFVLETAGKEWVYKQMERASISNRLTIKADGDAYSGGKTYDFKKTHLEPLYSHFSGSADRLEQTGSCLATTQNSADLMNILRTHRADLKNPLAQGSVASPCMHAGGLVGDHTTASMIVELGDQIWVWLTGSSTPCISLFKPWLFGSAPAAPVFAADDPNAEAYWLKHETFHRLAIGRILPEEFYTERNNLEAAWLTSAENADQQTRMELSLRATAEETAFYEKWSSKLTSLPLIGKRSFHKYWQRKNAALGYGKTNYV